ncbi:MAG: MFS transporter [Spirochaetales bacterium]|nr:MAG: MFS transporter [Spirochaetales bacterium]
MAASKMPGRDRFILVLLILMSVFLYADQRIMSAILPELSLEYGVTERLLGFIGSAFTLVGALVSIFFGYFTDRISRKTLLVLTVLIGEIPCLLTGFPIFTQTVTGFTVLRILTGIGIGGIYPISFSLIADIFKEQHRAAASAWLGVSWAIGMMLGPALAGYLTGTYGWRIAFILAAVPNFPLVAVFAIFAREPARGKTEEALEDLIQKGVVYKQRIHLKDFKLIFSNRTNIWTFLQGIPGTIPWGILGYWMILFLERTRHFSKEVATTVYLMLGIGTTLGSVVFAMIGGRLYRKNPRLVPILCGIGVLIGIIPALPIVNLSVSNPQGGTIILYYLLSFVTGFLVSVPSANVKAILMNVNRPEHRGSVFAVFNITDNLGQGFGPALGGMLVSVGYVFMMNFSIFFWIPCGIIFFAVARFINMDRDNLQKLLKERAEEMKSNPAEPASNG